MTLDGMSAARICVIVSGGGGGEDNCEIDVIKRFRHLILGFQTGDQTIMTASRRSRSLQMLSKENLLYHKRAMLMLPTGSLKLTLQQG